ncbi:MAG: lytic transglycosylase domain-containing protein [Xanthobacteraceae bacterium]|nr:lytic transglycosylase domain-containing protein [Xanthobacteraceae bacterium]
MATAGSLALTTGARAASESAGAKPQAAKAAAKTATSKPAASKPAAATKAQDAKKAHATKPETHKAAAKKKAEPKKTEAKKAPSKPPSKSAAPAKSAAKPAAKPHPAAALPAPRIARKPSLPSVVAATSSTSQADLGALQNVIELVRRRKQGEATQVEAAIGDPVARKLAEWIILRSADNGAGVERYQAFLAANPGWPSQTFLRRRAEAALWDDRRDDAAVLGYFQNETPLSYKGRLVLGRALLARGDRANAERLIREAWRDDNLTAQAMEAAVLDQFGALLRPADHKARMDALLYGNDGFEAALRAAHRLGGDQVALARARIAVSKRAANAKALLDAVPGGLHDDAGYIFSKIQWLRRQERVAEAGRLMLSAPRDPARLHDLDEWWIERRVLARELLDIGDNRTAYLVARDAALPAKDVYKTQKEFTAGWIALRFLKDPATATQHFARIAERSDNPTALARAGYWLGRAAEASGRGMDARAAYQSAAAHSTSYYGQLARAKLGLPQIEINRAPGAGLRGGDRFEMVRAAQLLYALNEGDLVISILADLGDNAEAEVLAGLGDLASRHNDARGQLLLGKAAINRGLPFDVYAFPATGLPHYRPIGPEVDPSVLFAIARQESGFNPSVVSPAQAYGLMQVTPSAAKYVTRKYGATYDLGRLRNDSVYNTTLGAAELGGLLEDYRGSYIMTFAAYNAGRGSLRKWIARYGDPRDPNVDAVDWVERIPFSETRNYVQRIMENLQVYRARFGGGTRLQIEADLHRGASVQ